MDEFISGFEAAARSGVVTFLQQRVHPQLIDLYGREQCNAFIESEGGADPAYAIDVGRVTGPASWTLEVDGATLTIPDTFTADITVTQSDGSFPQEMHLALIDQRLYWFTDCGDPRVTSVTAPAALTQISGDTTSTPFDAPTSWRIEVETSDFCGVTVYEDATGDVVEVKSGETGFLMQVRSGGRFYIETTGCRRATAYSND